MRKYHRFPSIFDEEIPTECDIFNEILSLYRHGKLAGLLRSFEEDCQMENQHSKEVDVIDDPN